MAFFAIKNITPSTFIFFRTTSPVAALAICYRYCPSISQVRYLRPNVPGGFVRYLAQNTRRAITWQPTIFLQRQELLPQGLSLFACYDIQLSRPNQNIFMMRGMLAEWIYLFDQLFVGTCVLFCVDIIKKACLSSRVEILDPI